MVGTHTSYETEKGHATSEYYINPSTDPVHGGWHRDTADGDLGLHLFGVYPFWSPIGNGSVAYKRALLDYLKNVRAQMVQMSGPTFLGELKETIGMIRRPMQALRNSCGAYLDSLKKAKRNNPHTWKRGIAGTWLEHSFGWTPLLHDVKDAYEAYFHLTDAVDRTQVPVSGFGGDAFAYPNGTFSVPGPVAIGSGGIRIQYSGEQRCVEKYVVKFKGMVTKSIAATKLERGIEAYGFTPSEFLPTAWELLPWSFLIDYFTDIGEVISANVTDTTRIAWTNVSQVNLQLIQQTCGYLNPPPTYKTEHKSGWGDTLTSKTVKRTVTRTPNVTVNAPRDITLSIPGSPYQWANMLALFSQSNAIHPQSLPYPKYLRLSRI
jgi:hypothetical protein